MKLKFRAFLIVIILTFCSFANDLKDVKVDAQGFGQNSQEALLNAKRNAVEKGIGTIISSQTEIQNFMVNKDLVITKTLGAVKNFTIISQTKGPDGAVEVNISAVVSSQGISDDLMALKILSVGMDKPRIMVLIKETNMGEDVTPSASGAEIERFLTEKEFELVDANTVEKLKNKLKASIASGNPEAATEIGEATGAEMIISGTAIAKIAQTGVSALNGMNSCQADISLKVIDCGTAKIITAKTQHSAVLHINQTTGGIMAITKATKEAMDNTIFQKILASWQDAINNGRTIKVIASGVKTLATSKSVTGSISGASMGVVSVIKRNWNEKSGIMELDVSYKGTPDGLAETIDNYMISETEKITVTGSGEGGLKIKVASK